MAATPAAAPAPAPAPAPKKASSPKTKQARPSGEGTLDKALISGVVRRNMGQVRFCYEQQLRDYPTLRGTVDVKFVISETGQVVSPTVASATTHNAG